MPMDTTLAGLPTPVVTLAAIPTWVMLYRCSGVDWPIFSRRSYTVSESLFESASKEIRSPLTTREESLRYRMVTSSMPLPGS